MKRLIIISNLIFLFLSLPTNANQGKNSCNNLSHSFNLLFEANDSDVDKTVFLVTNKAYTALWTNDKNISNRIFLGVDNSRVWIKYEPQKKNDKKGKKNEGKKGGNKSGIFSLYMEKNGTWGKPIVKAVDLSNFSKSFDWKTVKLSSFQCLGGSEPPVRSQLDLSNYCDLFPGPAQTWKFNPSDSLYIANGSTVYGTKNVDNQNFVGFNNLSGQNVANGCDNNQCNSDNALFVEPVALGEFPTLPYPSYPVDGNTTFNESEHGVLGAVTVNQRAILTINSGTYWNDSMNILGKVIIRKNQKVVIHTKALALSQNSEFMIEDGASLDDLLIFVHDKPFTSQSVIHPRVDFSQGSTFKGLVYSERQTELSNNVNYYGAITALYINMHNNSTIHGNSACFNPPEVGYDISVSPIDDLSLICERQSVEFQVTNNNGEMVSDYNGQIKVTTKDSFPSGNAFWYFSVTGGEASKKDISLENSFDVDSSGKALLWLKSNYVGSIEITGKLSTDKTKQDVGNYQFVPFKLEIQRGELKAVAGKPRDITITAKACTDSSEDNSVAEGYHGTRTLRLSTEYAEPDTGTANIFLKDKNGAWQSSEGKFEFDDNGSAISELKYDDAGKTKLKFSDPNCTKDSCDIEPIAALMKAKASSSDDWEQLEGSQAIAIRPYTFALCNNGNNTPLIESASGTSESGNGFVAAGETFELKVKPVIWTDTDASNNDIGSDQNASKSVDSSNMCGRQITPNFYVGGPPTAMVALSIPSGDGVKPHSPDKAGAVAGTLTSSALSNTQIKNTPYSASWSEVGSVWLQADTQAEYLGMDVNMGRRPVGRFYPKYFVIKESALVDAVNNVFTYMDQGFQISFTVEARNKNAKPTENYGLFKATYQEELDLVAIDSQVGSVANNDLTPRLDTALLPSPATEWAKNWEKAILTLNATAVGFKRESTADGPYQVHLGLLTKTRDNCSSNGCTDFSINDLEQRITDGATPVQATKLNGDIDARYGRMRLEDVAVPVTQDAQVPVIVEYYLNSKAEFVTNDDDDASLFGSKHGCSQLIFPNPMRSKLADSPTSESVNAGEGSLLVTRPLGVGVTNGYREQVRLGQRLSSAAPTCPPSGSAATSNQPWLQYNWRDKGDEDPSAIVTFGVYRGNDRIIYRGEKGMNKLLN